LLAKIQKLADIGKKWLYFLLVRILIAGSAMVRICMLGMDNLLQDYGKRAY
jgi:hypothetical protein